MTSTAPVIRKLSQETVNRIAAGEVVQRPSAAIKELIENSIDAGSTNITVVIKHGGLQMMQIQDNGHGIRKDDLPIVCERFTTSKITRFEDLESISTFGFRGEALASITYVSHVSILTKTADSPCAFKAKYLDGKLLGDISPCAGNNGTIITVEDLFYNMATRKQAFKSPGEEYQRILDVLTKYSIHYASRNISLTCKKHGQFQPDLHTPNNSNTLETLRLVYGSTISRELLPFHLSVQTIEDGIHKTFESSHLQIEHIRQGSLHFSASGYLSNANYSNKKSIFILFINDRLVDCQSIRRTVEAVYAEILPRHGHPFVYLSLQMPAIHVDVNVHPTKKEVHFMFETEILEYILEGVRQKLCNANESRTFYTQSLLTSTLSSFQSTSTAPALETQPAAAAEEEEGDIGAGMEEETELDFDAVVEIQEVPRVIREVPVAIAGPEAEGVSRKKKLESNKPLAPNKLIRTDHTTRRLDEFFKPVLKELDMNVPMQEGPAEQLQREEQEPVVKCSRGMDTVGAFAVRCKCCVPSSSSSQPEVPVSVVAFNQADIDFTETTCQYDSVRTLIAEIHDKSHAGYQAMLKKHTLIGVVDATYCLVQFGTKILLVDHAALSYSLFRQLVIRRFKSCPLILLENKVPIKEYLAAAYDILQDPIDAPHDAYEVVASKLEVLQSKGPMLQEYFSICIDEEGNLVGLPELLKGYLPLLEEAPMFLWRLASLQQWNDEYACFDSIAHTLGLFYAALPVEGTLSETLHPEERLLGPQGEATVVNTFLPAIRQLVISSNDYDDMSISVQLASLEQLYKIFERC